MVDRSRRICVLLLLPLTICLCGSTATTTNPARVQVVTSDVAHFWQAFDAAGKVPPAQRAAVYRKDYFDRASQGLRDFDAFRHVTAQSLAFHVERHRAYYSALRPYIQQVVNQKPAILAAFHRLAVLYPGIKLPLHIYFVVGAQHGAGMNSPHGIILAAEMFATPPGIPYAYNKVSPIYVPFSAVHETIHLNQTYETSNKSTLLQEVINEGTADFIASLVVQEPDVRQMTDPWKYGCRHEKALFAQFEKQENQTRTAPWMFVPRPANGWPPDMGYWLGYRIAQTYYDRAADKRAALTNLLAVTDFHHLLAESGYPARAPACAPERAVR